MDIKVSSTSMKDGARVICLLDLSGIEGSITHMWMDKWWLQEVNKHNNVPKDYRRVQDAW